MPHRTMTTRMLLLAGAAGPVLFVATVILGAALTPGYSHLADPVSALSQRGAVHATWINALFLVAAVLQTAIGVALLGLQASLPHLRRAGVLIVIYAVLAALIATFLPMDPIGAPVTPRGVGHLVLVALSALALVAAMILARRFPGAPWFTAFSWTCLAVMGLGGILAAVAGLRGWPLTGLGERLTQLAYLTWLFALAILARYRTAA